ncbi:hypothetical protein HYN49_06015 [Flavobacterium pallidum]|uniref:Uncharacterized protein n=1 Tax=Flavobacterium pallidum TaxID=2172098 RepID=A0A2S1SGF2_9FLAO|nr:hypothetical protein HYN49_06015 [Flavobacterium pallidum]
MSLLTVRIKNRQRPSNDIKTKLLIWKKKERLVARVLQTTNPTNKVSMRLKRILMSLEKRIPRDTKRTNDNNADTRIAVIVMLL